VPKWYIYISVMLQNIGSSVETNELNLKVRTSHLIFTTYKILLNECPMYIYNACKEAVELCIYGLVQRILWMLLWPL